MKQEIYCFTPQSEHIKTMKNFLGFISGAYSTVMSSIVASVAIDEVTGWIALGTAILSGIVSLIIGMPKIIKFVQSCVIWVVHLFQFSKDGKITDEEKEQLKQDEEQTESDAGKIKNGEK